MRGVRLLSCFSLSSSLNWFGAVALQEVAGVCLSRGFGVFAPGKFGFWVCEGFGPEDVGDFTFAV